MAPTRRDNLAQVQARLLHYYYLSAMLGYLHEDLQAVLAGDGYVGAQLVRP
jgi:hypothetical protein